ncbi:hypothetical protein ANN_10967, partial [Periplaneta americana]
FLTTGTLFRSLALSFRVGKPTVSVIVKETCEVIWQELIDEFMPQPTSEKLNKVATEYYQRWGFPNCFGTIEANTVSTEKLNKVPTEFINVGFPNCFGAIEANIVSSSYFNYLKYFSVVLQGVADADKKFLTIEVEARGKQSDGGIFTTSTLFSLLETNQFNVSNDEELPKGAAGTLLGMKPVL